MDIDSSRIQELIDRPGESLSVELKRWIDPDDPEGIEKIVRATLALRNHGGGYLVVGFDNDTQPDKNNVPADVKSAFHIDNIQALISKYASEPFEVTVEFREREGQSYPVIVVPSGVTTPVVVKSDLWLNEKKLIAADDVYVRSPRSNNTPSTTKAGWKDWEKIVGVCFDNREADIGRFLRRHLSGITPEMLQEFASAITKGAEPEATSEDPLRRYFQEIEERCKEVGGITPEMFQESPEMLQEFASVITKEVKPEATTEDLLRKYLQESEERYKEVVKERAIELPDHGVWEVALILVGAVPAHSANRKFLNLLDASNPDYTGWPVWFDSHGFTDESAHPYVLNGVWEAFVASFGSGFADHLDFMRLNPGGRFYLRRALEDDISGSPRAPKPLSVLDFGLPIIRTAEAIAVGITFAKAMGCNPENTLLAFAFRWTRLRGRELGSWAQPGRDIWPGRPAYQDDVTALVNVPLETPLSALSEFVNQAVQRLFEVFDGFTLSKNVVEDLTRRLVERKL